MIKKFNRNKYNTAMCTIQDNLRIFLDNFYGTELYFEMFLSGNNFTIESVIQYLKENNCLCSNESETIENEFLPVVQSIHNIFMN